MNEKLKPVGWYCPKCRITIDIKHLNSDYYLYRHNCRCDDKENWKRVYVKEIGIGKVQLRRVKCPVCKFEHYEGLNSETPLCFECWCKSETEDA